MIVYQCLGAAYGIINVLLCWTFLQQSLKRRSLAVIVWFLAGVFAAVAAAESLIAPVYLTIGTKVYATDADTICKAALFMLIFNVLMAAGEKLLHLLLPFPVNRAYLYDPRSYPRDLRTVAYCLVLPLTISAALYVKRVLSYSNYVDRYLDNTSAWEMVILVACWSIVPVAIIFRLRLLVALAVTICAGVIAVAQVRYFALFFIIPAILFWIMKTQALKQAASQSLVGRRVRNVARWVGITALLAFATYATYINLARNGDERREFTLQNHQFAELWLVKGFYSLIPTFDSGIELMGMKSYVDLKDALLFPYLYYMEDYEYPIDTTVYTAHLIGGFRLNDIHKWPLLIYCDSYYAFGFTGCALGLLWGLIYTGLDFALTSRRVFVFLGPFAVWFFYQTFRGAVSNSVYSIPRELYINVVLMALAGAVLTWPRRTARQSVEPTSTPLEADMDRREPVWAGVLR